MVPSAAPVEAEAQLNHSAQVDKFMKDMNWVQCFLPTLTYSLYTSSSLFADFTKQSPQFLRTAQAVFDLAFPTVTFVLQPDDKIVTEVHTKLGAPLLVVYIIVIGLQAVEDMAIIDREGNPG